MEEREEEVAMLVVVMEVVFERLAEGDKDEVRVGCKDEVSGVEEEREEEEEVLSDMLAEEVVEGVGAGVEEAASEEAATRGEEDVTMLTLVDTADGEEVFSDVAGMEKVEEGERGGNPEEVMAAVCVCVCV